MKCHFIFLILLNTFRFKQTESLGQKILQRKPCVLSDRDLRKKLLDLQDDKAAIDDAWIRRNKQLQEWHSIQIFNREADQIDSVTSSHQAFLEFDDLGVRKENWFCVVMERNYTLFLSSCLEQTQFYSFSVTFCKMLIQMLPRTFEQNQ